MRSRSSIYQTGGGGGGGIYWDSVDSSGDSSGSSSRNYVDPWDLENYAYLRRHSIAIADVSPQPIYQSRRSASYATYYSRLSHHSPDESDYWCTPATREPGYDAPASVEEIYFRPPRPISTAGYCQHRPIYEDESLSQYTPYPSLYNHLSEFDQAEAVEEIRSRGMVKRCGRSRNHLREECIYHGRTSELLMIDGPTGSRYAEEELVDEVEASHYRRPIKTSHMSLNKYGHLKIDYTNSWNSLHRKISKCE